MSARGIAFAVRPAVRRFRLPAFVRASAVLGGLVAGVAFAAPALAAVGDRIPFQQFRSKVCPAGGICSANFGVVPANSRFEVKSVSCFLFTQDDDGSPFVSSVEFAVLNATGEIIMHDFAIPVFEGYNSGSGASFAVNNETFFFAPPGGRVRVVMSTTHPTTGLELDCKIAGERVVVQ